MKRLALIAVAAGLACAAATPAGACAADDPCLHDPLVAPVTGHSWLDGDADGEFDADERDVRVPSSVWADYNRDGVRQPGETSVPTEADGSYSLPVDTRRLSGDTVLVRWGGGHTSTPGDFAPQCVAPSVGCTREVRVAAGQTTGGIVFPVVTQAQLNGTIWDDRNENGRREAGEDGVAGLRVFLDENGNGSHEAGEPISHRTPIQGRYTLVVPVRFQAAGGNLPPLRVEEPAGVNCTAPADCALTGLRARSWEVLEADHGVARPVVIFTHGYGGARIVCGDRTLWFNVPVPNLMDIRLGTDGQNLRAADGGTECSQNARVDGLVMDVVGADIYGSSSEYFERISWPGRHYDYVWDWRKDPTTAVADLDALVEKARREHGVSRVVLVGHSQGGLVMRHYVDDPGRAVKVSRAVTVGTPYWGSPKTILPLAAGIEVPWFSEMDIPMTTLALKSASRSMPGHFSLVPAFGYGQWLSVNGEPRDMDGVKAYMKSIGVDPQMYTNGAAQHGRVLDHFEDNGVDYHVIVGGGVPTIGRIGIKYGILDQLEVEWTSGDETVPQRSAAHDTPADRLHVVCGLKHVPITSALQTTMLMGEFLIRAEAMKPGRESCNWTARELTVYYPSQLTPMAGAAQAKAQPRVTVGGRSLTLAEAERAGHVQLVKFGGGTTIVGTGDVQVTLPAGGTAVVRDLSEKGAGAERRFVGATSVALGGSGAVTGRGGKALKPVARDRKAPKTKASWRRGKLVLRAKDASKVAGTFVIVGGKQRVYKKPMRLTAKQARKATYGSVDIWGNAEKARRAPAR